MIFNAGISPIQQSIYAGGEIETDGTGKPSVIDLAEIDPEDEWDIQLFTDDVRGVPVAILEQYIIDANKACLVVNAEYNRQLTIYLDFLLADKDMASIESIISAYNDGSDFANTAAENSSYFSLQAWQAQGDFGTLFPTDDVKWEFVDDSQDAQWDAIWENVQRNATLANHRWDELQHVQYALFKEEAYIRWSTSFLRAQSKKVKQAAQELRSNLTDKDPMGWGVGISLYDRYGAEVQAAMVPSAKEWFLMTWYGMTEQQLMLKYKRLADFDELRHNASGANPLGIYIPPDHLYDFPDDKENSE